MCSEIDAHTRDNPESAMMHNTQRGISQTLTPEEFMLQQQFAYWASHQNAYMQQFSGIPSVLRGAEDNLPKIDPSENGAQKRETFDSDAHRAFMRSLG